MKFSLTTAAVAIAALAGSVVGAEVHTVIFTNICGAKFGTPKLVQNGVMLSNGEPHTVVGPLISAIAYLQTGTCGLNGENCALIETTLENLSDGGNSGSLTDINVRPPHAFNVATSFKYFNGCDGEGAFCSGPNCDPAPVSCQEDNVNLNITFCVEAVPTLST
ncbi:hypothetical protein V8D89_001623 [Ganoderma adspersum]